MDTACSNGLIQPDTLLCECEPCYQGSSCSILAPECQLDVSTNQAFVLEQFWDVRQQQGQLDPDLHIPLTYRNGYDADEVISPDGSTGGSPVGRLLAQEIRAIHEASGNVEDIDKYWIVVGHGGTQVFGAAYYGLSMAHDRHYYVTADVPYYYLAPEFVDLRPSHTTWRLDVDDPSDYIELVTCPNNPDGILQRPRYPDAAHTITDAVFNWPHYLAGSNDLIRHDSEIIVYSLSKLTGHAGSRLGWALVEDEEVAKQMGKYIYYDSHGMSVDNQYRALDIFRALNKPDVNDTSTLLLNSMFNYTADILIDRWDRIVNLFDSQSQVRYTIAGERDFCLLWIRCMWGQPETCAGQFRQAGLLPIDGVIAGQPGYARLNMMGHDSTFELMIRRLSEMFQLS